MTKNDKKSHEKIKHIKTTEIFYNTKVKINLSDSKNYSLCKIITLLCTTKYSPFHHKKVINSEKVKISMRHDKHSISELEER